MLYISSPTLIIRNFYLSSSTNNNIPYIPYIPYNIIQYNIPYIPYNILYLFSWKSLCVLLYKSNRSDLTDFVSFIFSQDVLFQSSSHHDHFLLLPVHLLLLYDVLLIFDILLINTISSTDSFSVLITSLCF